MIKEMCEYCEKLNKFIAQMKIEHCFNEAEND